MPDPREKSERAARSASVVDFPGSIAGAASPDSPPGAIAPGKANRRTCPICGRRLPGRQTSACSDRCRAALSRRKRIAIERQDLQELRGLLQITRDRLWAAQPALDRQLGG